MKITFCLTIIVVLSACSSIQPLEVKFKPIKDYGIYSTSAATKSTIIRNKNDQQIVCSEPSPDATFNEQDKESLGFSLLHIGDKTTEGLSEGETEGGLGGRSVNVLLTREMYFRMCEFFANSNLPDSMKIKIYNATLASILKLNTTDFGTGTGSGSTTQALFNENNALELPDSLETGSSDPNDQDEDSDEEDYDDDDDF